MNNPPPFPPLYFFDKFPVFIEIRRGIRPIFLISGCLLSKSLKSCT
jgi:hypothetical protein